MTAYLIVKSLHLVSMVAWFAGLFYLPRLFVYHVSAEAQTIETLSVMERKLYRAIMWPAMVGTWLFGLGLIALNPAIFSGGWLHLKLALVLGLTMYHLSLGHFRKRLATDPSFRSERFFRLYNELPTLLLVAIIFLAVLRPF